MSIRLATRPADEERFREFRARRLAKKESDREKLAAEFPLLFNNKAVGNKVINNTLVLNKAATVVGPSSVASASKRKSTFQDKNDENCAAAANKINKPAPLGSKTPLSSKKQRKGSLLLSPKGQMQQSGLSKTLPAVPTYTIAASIVATTTAVTPQVTKTASPAHSVSDYCPPSEEAQEGVELTTTRKALFADAELESCTSGRSSLSSLGESIAPVQYQPAQPATETPTAHTDSAVQEQVLDVLDYLLELDEVDEQTYRRMSSTNFSAKALKRLSMTMTGPPPAPLTAAPAETAMEIATDATATTEEVECNSNAARCSTSVAMDVAYPAAEEDCVIGELDVLNALRTYLAALNKPAELPEASLEGESSSEQLESALAEEVPAAPQETVVEAVTEKSVITPVAADESADQSTLTCASTRSSTSSAGTFAGQSEWRDSLVPSDRRTSCTTTMRVSFCAAPRLSAVPSRASVGAAPLASALVQSTDTAPTAVTDTDAAPTTAAAPKQKGVVTYPLRELLDDALQRGLVLANVTGRMEMGTHTKYTVQTQILSVPGYPEENSKVRMMCLKRYADFKSLRASLLEAVEAQRRRANSTASSSRGTGSARSSLESGADILSIARSRRSSTSSSSGADRESLLLNARDSLCLLPDDGAVNMMDDGFGGAGRVSELIPPLPSRQIMSMSCASVQDEDKFQETREAFLRNWLEAVFSRQSCECAEYRLELRKFLTA